MEPQHSNSRPDDFRAFSRCLDGKVRSRHHAEYAGWYYGAAWNGRRFARYPEYIVRAGSVSDVVKTIGFARTHGLRVSVKGTGHSYSGIFLQNGGILLDLSLLDHLEIHAEQQIAVAGPGVTSAQLTEALEPHRLAFPTGHGGSVGLSGFLLGGGLGINCDAWGGMSTFNVEAVDLVTADGRILHADASQNSDCFWAARGGGPCLFFVVIGFHLKCWPAPRQILARSYRFDPRHIAPVLRAISERAGDTRLQVMVALAGGEELSASLSATAFCDTREDARALHGELFSLLSAWTGKEIDERELRGFQPIYDQAHQVMVSRRYRTDNIMTDDVESASRTLLSVFGDRPSPVTFSLLIPRPAHAYPDAAFSVRGKFFVSTYAQWNDESDDMRNRDWLAALYDELSIRSTGHYINEVDLEGRPGAVPRCFSGGAWKRLQSLRRRHDSEGVIPGVAHDATGPSDWIATKDGATLLESPVGHA